MQSGRFAPSGSNPRLRAGGSCSSNLVSDDIKHLLLSVAEWELQETTSAEPRVGSPWCKISRVMMIAVIIRLKKIM